MRVLVGRLDSKFINTNKCIVPVCQLYLTTQPRLERTRLPRTCRVSRAEVVSSHAPVVHLVRVLVGWVTLEFITAVKFE